MKLELFVSRVHRQMPSHTDSDGWWSEPDSNIDESVLLHAVLPLELFVPVIQCSTMEYPNNASMFEQLSHVGLVGVYVAAPRHSLSYPVSWWNGMVEWNFETWTET